jgi:hypothetical protein
MQIRTPQVKLALRLENATIEGDALVMSGLAGFLPCEARISAPEVKHLLKLMFRRETLAWTLRALLARTPGGQEG